MEGSSGQERTRRARAAWGYSLLSAQQLAVKLGVEKATVEGWLEKGKAPPPPGQLRALVEAAGIDGAFADAGFLHVAPEATELLRRIASLEGRVEKLRAKQLAAAAPPTLPDELGRNDPTAQPIEKKARRRQNPKAAGARKGRPR